MRTICKLSGGIALKKFPLKIIFEELLTTDKKTIKKNKFDVNFKKN